MKEHLAKLVEEYSVLNAPTGYEQPVIRRLRDHLRPLSDEFQIGVNGNVYARKQGKRPGLTLMIAAHMDEVGCVVRDIDPSGMIRFHKVGNFGDSWLAGARVRIKEIPGVIGIKAAHLMTDEEKRTALPHHSLYIDVGARNADEAEAMGIGIGDPIAFDVNFERFHNRDYLCGKALDNRVACAVLVALMENLSDGDFPGTVWAVGTVQEERGLAGARTATHFTKPDWFIALDIALATDGPENPPSYKPVRLGGGVVVDLVDFGETCKLGYYVHPGLKAVAFQTCAEKGIPVQHQTVYGGSFTDAAGVSRELTGVPSLSLGMPARYVHAPSSVCHLDDVVACLQLVEDMVRRGVAKKDLDFLQES
ncbi:MAG TPA: M42 family peptidase [Candidatus Methylomirabilis sp.]